MSFVQWSYSSMKTFQTCARQYKHKYILKDITDVPGEAALYGTDVHKSIEEYLRDDTPIPAKYSHYLPAVDAVRAWSGNRIPEYQMALGYDLRPCDFRDPHYFVRGIADVVVVDGRYGRVVDWKTGKSAKFADPKQLELMALMMFAHFPELEAVQGALVFLVPDKIITDKFYRTEEKARWARWLYEVSRIESALALDNFVPNPNNLCRSFCPVLSCEHNGRNE